MVIKNGIRNLSGGYIELDIFPEQNKGYDRLIQALNPMSGAKKAEELGLLAKKEKSDLMAKVKSFGYIKSMASETKKIGKKIEDLDNMILYYAKYQSAMERINSKELDGQEMLESLFELKVIRQ